MICGGRPVKQSYYDLDLRQYSKRFVRDFIETYRSLPALWKVRSKEYTDRGAKKEAYEKLATKLKEVDSNADRDTVKRKINSMRTTFRKEWRKVQSSRRSGGLGESVYKPTLWYYDLLLFLNEQESNRSFGPFPVRSPPMAVGSMFKQEPPDMEETADFIEEESQELYGSIQNSDESHEEDPMEERTIVTTAPLAIRADTPMPPPLPQPLVEETPEDVIKPTQFIPDDEFHCIARTWAIKLKRMSPMQKLFAERLVNDVLFEGELGTLSRISVLNVDSKRDQY
ncbi:uncharacterized protein [Hetaerina americana]|uniref:uncharacterized protein n=1 Tax=Hetaerina americana TaxID=62018 RepID=UPI003A7F4F23